MVDYVFPQDYDLYSVESDVKSQIKPNKYITQKGFHGKYPVKTCCGSDDLSGDMLAPSWPNLVKDVIAHITRCGILLGPIPVKRYSRQGDPITPCLLLLVAEIISCNIETYS